MTAAVVSYSKSNIFYETPGPLCSIQTFTSILQEIGSKQCTVASGFRESDGNGNL